MILLERDELEFVICRNIETEYMLKLGGLEYRAYEAQCRYLRLKRKAELIQARINRQERVSPTEIEALLDAEFEEYSERLKEQMGKMNDALARSRMQSLSEGDARELKRLYRQIMKTLHPDVRPDATKEQKRLLELATEAYKDGDLERLRAIADLAGGEAPAEPRGDAMVWLAEEGERLEKAIAAAREEMAAIKSRYPYTMKELLESEERVAQKRGELEEAISRYGEMAAALERRIGEMQG